MNVNICRVRLILEEIFLNMFSRYFLYFPIIEMIFKNVSLKKIGNSTKYNDPQTKCMYLLYLILYKINKSPYQFSEVF